MMTAHGIVIGLGGTGPRHIPLRQIEVKVIPKQIEAKAIDQPTPPKQIEVKVIDQLITKDKVKRRIQKPYINRTHSCGLHCLGSDCKRLKSYQNTAKQKGLVFDLTVETFYALLEESCHHCRN